MSPSAVLWLEALSRASAFPIEGPPAEVLAVTINVVRRRVRPPRYRKGRRWNGPTEDNRREAVRTIERCRRERPDLPAAERAKLDEMLDVLEDASPTEKEVLGAIRYQPNDVVLHTDHSRVA